jgi:hypothetical protein
LILVFGCLLSNMAGAEPQAETNIPRSTADAPIIFEVQDSYFHPKAVDSFNDYKTSLRLGRFDEAAAALTLIQALLTTENERATFWQKAIPDIQLRTLIIIQICPDCLTGQCLTCRGQGICPACQGKKQCPVCKGKKSFSTRCKACLCKACSASGICAKCRGYKFLRCPTCMGTGMGKQTASGTPMCPTCGGKRRLICSQCGGTGKCPTCAGKGRTSGCPQCNDTGVVVTTCTACRGTGKCVLCDNTGVCPACKGNGICPRCDKNGMITHYRFPVHADWVRLQAGYILHREQPAVTNQIVEKIGSFQVFCGSRKINLNVKANEIQCVSDGELFDWVKSQVLK